jgi:hypothetical protein
LAELTILVNANFRFISLFQMNCSRNVSFFSFPCLLEFSCFTTVNRRPLWPASFCERTEVLFYTPCIVNYTTFLESQSILSLNKIIERIIKIYDIKL